MSALSANPVQRKQTIIAHWAKTLIKSKELTTELLTEDLRSTGLYT